MQPTTIIVIAVHNEGRYLTDTLRSVLSQTYMHYTLVVSCNACSDDSLAIARSFQDIDERVTVLETPHLLPSIAHWTWIIDNIKNKDEYSYFLQIGGHDVLAPFYLELLVAELTKNPGCSNAYPADAFAIDEFGRIKFKYPPMPQTFSGNDIFQCLSIILSLRYNICSFGLIRAKFFFQLKNTPCYAVDHIKMGAICQHGFFKSVHNAQILVRDVGNSLNQYRLKHYGDDVVDISRDLANQFCWVDSICKELQPTQNQFINDSVRLSALVLYLVRYLDQFGGDIDQIKSFFGDKTIESIFTTQHQLMASLDQWIKSKLGNTSE